MASFRCAAALLVALAPLCLSQAPASEAITGWVSSLARSPVEKTAPDQEFVECPSRALVDGARRKSEALGPETKVVFNNTQGVPVSLFWIDYKGEEQFLEVIPAFGRIGRTGTMGHWFRVKDQTGRVLLDYLIGLAPIRNDAKVPVGRDWDTDEDEQRPTHPVDMASTMVILGFVNRAGLDLKLMWVTGNKKEELKLVSKMRREHFILEYSHFGHEFRALTRDDRFVASFRAGDVAVPSCPETPVRHDEAPLIEPALHAAAQAFERAALRASKGTSSNDTACTASIASDTLEFESFFHGGLQAQKLEIPRSTF